MNSSRIVAWDSDPYMLLVQFKYIDGCCSACLTKEAGQGGREVAPYCDGVKCCFVGGGFGGAGRRCEELKMEVGPSRRWKRRCMVSCGPVGLLALLGSRFRFFNTVGLFGDLSMVIFCRYSCGCGNSHLKVYTGPTSRDAGLVVC